MLCFYGCPNNSLPTQWLKTAFIHHLIVFVSQKSRTQSGSPTFSALGFTRLKLNVKRATASFLWGRGMNPLPSSLRLLGEFSPFLAGCQPVPDLCSLAVLTPCHGDALTALVLPGRPTASHSSRSRYSNLAKDAAIARGSE